jgi:DNA-binding transcriptional LysR family regulator
MCGDGGIELTQSFVVVAEELSFRRGAQRLNIDQSALTRRIQRLEQQLGFKLFERTTREVSLTPAGRSFYETNVELLRGYERAVGAARLVAQGKTGELRLAYMSFAATTLMPLAVSQYRRLYPHVALNLRYMRTQGQKLALAHDEIDVGYMIGPFDHPDFQSLVVSVEPLYLVAPRDHELTRSSKIRPADLAGQDLILGDMGEWEAYRWRLSDIFSAEGLSMNVCLEASNPMALLGLVAAGLGITIYPRSLIGFAGHNIDLRPIDDQRFCLETILVWKRTNRSKTVRAFIELAEHGRPYPD